MPLATLLAATGIFLTARTPKIDLSRVDPVPADQPIPVSDFFRPAAMQQPVLNPSGTRIAAVTSADRDKHSLLIYDFDTGKSDYVDASGDKDIYRAYWLGDSRVIFYLSLEKKYGIGLLTADVGRLRNAHPVFQYYYSTIVAIPPDDPLRPLVWNRYDALEDLADRDLGVVEANTNLKTGQLINLHTADSANLPRAIDDVREENDRHILRHYPLPTDGIVIRYIADQEGRLEFAIAYKDGRPLLLRLVRDRWEKCPVDLESVDVIDCGDEPGQLVVRGPRREGKPCVVEFMDSATAQPGRVLLDDADYDFFGGNLPDSDFADGCLYRDPVDHKVIGVMYERDGPKTVWFKEPYKGLQETLERLFPARAVRIVASDKAQRCFLIATYSDRQPLDYIWLDLKKHASRLLSHSAPWIDPKRMRPMQRVRFDTRDGRHLDAYLTLPAGATKERPPPLVVLPHNGPWVRDRWGYDGEVQFLASRGYAVLQPNYRGSLGYNWIFPPEDQFDFLKMQGDVIDATREMASSGNVDRRRIAILGRGFGGYLAVAAVEREPALFRCAVTVAGVFDWAAQVRDRKYDRFDYPTYDYYLRHLGDPKQRPGYFDAISLARQVARIAVPIFVAGGMEDNAVDISQSKHLISDLKRHHLPHESYIVREEGHDMQHLDKQVALYTRIEAFLAKYLLPASPVTTDAK